MEKVDDDAQGRVVVWPVITCERLATSRDSVCLEKEEVDEKADLKPEILNLKKLIYHLDPESVL